MTRNLDYFLLIVLLFALSLTGCQPIDTTNVNSTPASNGNANANLSPPQAANSAEKSSPVANLPVTMPLLDAMFADEAFAEEAKTTVNLTEDEIAKVRDAARNAVLKLGSDADEDELRSTPASVEKTRKEIERILGPQKSEEFIKFVSSRWAGESDELALAPPNSVPADTRIVVNSPAYRMDVFKDGKLTKTFKIGIGYPEFPLPTGLRRAKEIIFNPTWTPPDEPWVKGKVQPGKKVEAGSKLNPLGLIKIPIGLPSLIHGGKNPSRLGTFASHGCVGLTNSMVQDFALELAALSGTAIKPEDIQAFEKAKSETKEVKLAQPIPVELRYETIVAEDGKITIFRDVYERGTNTEENLRKVLDAFGVSLDQLPEADRAKLLNALSQMAVDAQGKAVPDEGNSNSANRKSKKVTRNIKGKKEIVVEIPALAGKGYPAPVVLITK